MKMPALSGWRAWVTGASSGIGAATAVALSGIGADVVLSARRSEKLEQLAQKIQKAGGKAIIKTLDVADRSAVRRTGSELEEMGGIDILINNAGLMPLAPVIEGRVDEWEQTIDVNVKGVLFCINAVFPGMANR
jgi:NADP-dependent 3-hydroxy acid dehydrogenase YdfG